MTAAADGTAALALGVAAPGSAAIRVAVVDDHSVVRSGLRFWLSQQPGLVFAGEADSGKGAVLLVQKEKVDVLLLDMVMPGQSGLDALAMLRAKAPSISILIFSAYPDDGYGTRLIRLGARGFISKSCKPEELVQAIRCVAAGKPYLSEALAARLREVRKCDVGAPHERLTRREFQIFLKLASGVKPAAIAVELHLSAKTVTMYRVRVINKLELATNSDLTYYAMKQGLIL